MEFCLVINLTIGNNWATSDPLLAESCVLNGEYKQEAQMGLISLNWVFCHNLVKIHLVVIEILSFSCSVLLLVKADGNLFPVPNCKKIKMA